MGIVTEVQTNTFFAVRGDIDNTVRSDMLALTDPSITGWGMTEAVASKLETPPEVPIPPPAEAQNVLLDIANGPALYIINST